MFTINVKRVAELCGGKILTDQVDFDVDGITIDSRSVRNGDCFIALIGDRFDGHDFIDSVISNGVRCLIVSNVSYDFFNRLNGKVCVIRVDDTLGALQNFSKFFKSDLLLKTGFESICVTGSNGKTTTKDLLSSIFSRSNSVCATPGNFNNHIGLPLSILSAKEVDRYGIFELGMNHEGEIAFLADIVKPDVAVITNIGSAHLEFMGSKDAIAREKASVIDYVRKGGFVVLNAEDDYYGFLANYAKEKDVDVISVGFESGDLRAELKEKKSDEGCGYTYEVEIVGDCFGDVRSDLIFCNDGKRKFDLVVSSFSKYFILNALLAVSVGLKHKLSIEDIVYGIKESKISSGRMDFFKLDDVLVIDDSYNANPDSMKAGLDSLFEIRDRDVSRRLAVLGYMAELGDFSQDEHLKLGRYCRKLGIDRLVTIGEEAKVINQGFLDGGDDGLFEINFLSITEAGRWLFDNKKCGDLYLFKGSRMAKVDLVLEEFKNLFKK